MSSWLVTGATGLLGANAMSRLAADAEVTGAARRLPRGIELRSSFRTMDLGDPRSFSGIVESSGADVVLHSGAVATIEACEADPEYAWQVNVRASEELARQARDAGAAFVFVSSDAVFDGTAGPYVETDRVTPTTVYGRSKVEAEERVLAAHPDAIVARVNFYGWSPDGRRSLAEFFYRNLLDGNAVRGFTDITVTTAYAAHLVDAIRALVKVKASGTFHATSSSAVTKYEFGRLLADVFGFDHELVTGARSTDVLATPRGANISLVTDKLASAIGRPVPGVVEGLRQLRADRETGHAALLSAYRPEEQR